MNVHEALSESAIKYAQGNDELLQDIPSEDLESIFKLIVLTDHHGKFGGKKIPKEKLPEHVSPLLTGNDMEKRYFLLDLCKRVCREQLADMDLSPVPWETLIGDQQRMLESAKKAAFANGPLIRDLPQKGNGLIWVCIMKGVGE